MRSLTPRSDVVRTSRRLYRGFAALTLALLAAACNDTTLESRTFELRYLSAGEAAEAVDPYVYADRPDAPGRVSTFGGGISVRETPDNLDRIARVLERLDRPTPGVRLHFQVIQADGSDEADPRIEDVEDVLRRLFRYEGYRLLAEAQMGGMEGSSSTQVVRDGGNEFGIRATLQRIQSAGDGGSVRLHVLLSASDVGTVIETAMTVPLGRTVVLGSAKPDPDAGALILTVRPEPVVVEETAGEATDGGTDPGEA